MKNLGAVPTHESTANLSPQMVDGLWSLAACGDPSTPVVEGTIVPALFAMDGMRNGSGRGNNYATTFELECIVLFVGRDIVLFTSSRQKQDLHEALVLTGWEMQDIEMLVLAAKVAVDLSQV